MSPQKTEIAHLRKALRTALNWCKQDATNEDCSPDQEMLDNRVLELREALAKPKAK